MDMNTEDTIDQTFGTVTNPAGTQYHSHAKISNRNGAKKGSVEHVSNHQMSAVIPDQYDVFPGVKGAERHPTKKTF